MFIFRRGETLAVSQKKTRLRIDAKREWPEVASLDLAQVNTEWQLSELVRSATGRSVEIASSEVRDWMERRQLRPVAGAHSFTQHSPKMEVL